ncbi:phosphoglucosamine mutase [uncultured Algimonas sp.]|uniref:phosphoglucosamine mutase n=1 Tax=uncultured Algimonas sp. TaxID=1547920 RepID=UPI002620D455|nr:phosphoglucosamine mutase [uncultured Algimonas sp.]
MTRYFGTDGIRGRAGEGKLSAASVAAMADAIGAHFGPGSQAVIGRDTRESGPGLEAVMTERLVRQGVDVTALGVLPTPAAAMTVPHLDADFGLMITASHNPWHDNGVKLFGADGRKISDADQDAIEALIRTSLSDGLPAASRPGEHRTDDGLGDVYVETLQKAYRAVGGADLSGLSIVVDAANGAAYRTLPATLRALGADPVLIGTAPDGRNINAGCGSTHTDALVAQVRQAKADVGVALDGDADRLILVDSDGAVVDGDQIIARLATDWQASGRLRGRAVVSTVMSNLGLEHYLDRLGLALERTPVGDRHVAARMAELDANLGGEPSGHLLMTDHAVTGDGSLAALMILAGLAASGATSASWLRLFDPLPQILRNVRYSGPSPLETDSVKAAIRSAQDKLADTGRLLVRASGTEPLIRVMAEGSDPQLVSATVEEVCKEVASAAR